MLLQEFEARLIGLPCQGACSLALLARTVNYGSLDAPQQALESWHAQNNINEATSSEPAK